MKKAALVLATSVAFFFGAMNAEAGRKMVSMPSAKSVATGAGTAVKDTDRLRIPGEPGTEYIPRTPSGTAGTPIKVLPTLDYSIPRTITQAKNILKGNLGQILLQGSIAAAVGAVGWVMSDDNTKLVKKTNSVDNIETSGGTVDLGTIEPTGVCQLMAPSKILNKITPVTYRGVLYSVWVGNFANIPSGYTLYGNNCTQAGFPGGTVSRARPIASTDIKPMTVPLGDSDWSSLDPYITAQGADWLKDLLRWSCSGTYGGANPDGCYQSLVEQTRLTGPAAVAGPSTTALVSGPNGITTVSTTTTYNIRYGDNFFDWTTSVNTHKVNPDGTTEDTTETEEEQQEEPEAPALGDPYAPEIQKYKDIATEVSNPPQVPANVNYSPWYSFGGNCSELNLVLPIYGPYTTNICPYIYDWVRPVLAFLLAMYTWHRCREMWTEALRIARPI